MARNLVHRIEVLEGAAEGDQPGACTDRLTVPPMDFDAVRRRIRQAYLQQDGFDIEEISPPQAEPPAVPVDIEQVLSRLRAHGEQGETLRKKLNGLDREAQRELAARHGYRVIYADEGKS